MVLPSSDQPRFGTWETRRKGVTRSFRPCYLGAIVETIEPTTLVAILN